MPDGIHLSRENIAAAGQRVAERSGQTAPVPVRLSPYDLQKAERQKKFYLQEPAIHRQRYLGVDKTSGRNINSCRIASSVIALVRMGVIKEDPNSLNRLEDEVVRTRLQLPVGHILANGDTGTTTANEIFTNFGLANGTPRNMSEALATLHAGGCIVIGTGGHARCITEVDGESKRLKVFDPLQSTSQLQSTVIVEDAIREAAAPHTIDLVAVFPLAYFPNATKGETFFDRGLTPKVAINTTPYLK